MPTINESELSSEDIVPDCVECDEFEGAIYLCGEGYLCERCFSKLAGIDEETLFKDDGENPLLGYEVPDQYAARAKANLMDRVRDTLRKKRPNE